jgi:AraC-like DNA-binding protein
MLGSFLLHSDDLGETEAILAANFGQIRIDAKSTEPSTKARIWRKTVGPFTVDEAQFGYDFTYDMEPPFDVLLCRVRSGVLEEHLPHQRTVYGPNKVVAFGATEGVPFSGAVNRALYDLMVVDRGLLGEVAGDPSVRLTSTTPMNDDANRLLVDAIDYVRHGVVANPHVERNHLMAGALARYLAGSVLAALPHTTTSARSIRGRPDTSLVRLRRAMAFIDDHAHADISLADIATATGMTPRSLQYTFRRYRNCTPTEYLRTVRLHYARRDLDAGHAVDTVSDVAHRWGFVNVDRFALDYLRTFGRLPAVVDREVATAPGAD